MKNTEKKIKISTLVYSVALVGLAALVLAGGAIYGFGADNSLARKAEQIFPYPAAIINGVNIITINNLNGNVAAVKKFYENQDFSTIGMKVDFATADGQKRLKIKERAALTKMIEDRVIEVLANQRGIKLTQAAVSQEVEKRMAEAGSQQDLANNLQKLYGWTVADFEAKVVKPDLYKNQLEEKIKESDPQDVEAKKKIDQALSDLQAKKDFGEVAKKYSDGDSAKNGGELGWFSANQMLPEIAMSAIGLKKGERSEVIRSSLGYHIIEVEDRKNENGEDKMKLRQIFARTQNFSDWLSEQEKNFRIMIPLKDFRWNKESGAVEFTDGALTQFENELDKNSPDDASVLF